MGRLDGKAAVVTGAGRGIGRAIAELLAAEGAAVVVNDVGSDVDGRGAGTSVADEVVAAIREKGGRAVASHESVADYAAAERIVGTAVREFGAIDSWNEPNSFGSVQVRKIVRTFMRKAIFGFSGVRNEEDSGGIQLTQKKIAVNTN